MERNDIVKAYRKYGSIKQTAINLEISEQMVRKVLLSEGEYTSDKAQQIAELQERGFSNAQIAEKLGISTKAVCANSVYSKSCWLDEPTENALKIRKCRAKKSDNGDE